MERSLRLGRLATITYFALNGFVLGVWVVHIPAVEQRAGVSHSVLGWLLLLLGGGAFVGMRLAGPLTDRWGAHRAVPASAALCGAALIGPGLATSAWTLGVAVLALGFGNGCLDVSMNAHAVEVERGYGRPIMSAFHAMFSIGGLAAALVGAATLSWGWPAPTTLTLVGLAGAAVAVLAAPALLRPDAPSTAGVLGLDAAPALEAPVGAGRRTAPRIWTLAVLAFMLMLCEGVANDWSVLAMRDVLDAPAGLAALAYGAYSTTMTIGRLGADRVAGRFGPVAVVRHGTTVAAVGLLIVVVAPWAYAALFGWALFGVGLSGCVPQLFSAAGHADQDAAGVNVSRVAGLGYLGMLAGPAVIGYLTKFIALNLAFLLPVALCVIAAYAAQILRPAVRPNDRTSIGVQ